MMIMNKFKKITCSAIVLIFLFFLSCDQKEGIIVTLKGNISIQNFKINGFNFSENSFEQFLEKDVQITLPYKIFVRKSTSQQFAIQVYSCEGNIIKYLNEKVFENIGENKEVDFVLTDECKKPNFCIIAEPSPVLFPDCYLDNGCLHEVGHFNPKESGEVDDISFFDIFISGNYAYISDNVNGLWIIDISDPVNPIKTGRFDFIFDSVFSSKLFVKDNYVYLVYYLDGLKIIDVSIKDNPIVVGSYQVDNEVMEDIYVQDNYALITSYKNYFKILDISDPSNISVLGIYTEDDPDFNYSFTDVIIKNNYAFILNDSSNVVYNGLYVFDISNPSFIEIMNIYYSGENPVSIFISDNFSYLIKEIYSNNIGVLETVDITDLTLLDGATNFYSKNNVNFNDLFVQDKYAYIATQYTNEEKNGLLIIDVNDENNPQEISFYQTDSVVWSVFVSGSYAYLASDDGGLRIISLLCED